MPVVIGASLSCRKCRREACHAFNNTTYLIPKTAYKHQGQICRLLWQGALWVGVCLLCRYRYSNRLLCHTDRAAQN